MVLTYEGLSYEEVQKDFSDVMEMEIDNPKLQYQAVVRYNEYLEKIEKNKDEKISDIALHAFIAVQPYLDYVKEKAGYKDDTRKEISREKENFDITRLSSAEREVYKEVQLMLWKRIEKYAVSNFPVYIKKNKNEKDDLYQFMYKGFVEKMIFQYKPFFSKRNSNIRPTTYFKAYVYRNAFAMYQSAVSGMTKHDIKKNGRIQRAIQEMETENIAPTEENIAEKTGYSISVVRKSLRYVENKMYLDASIEDDHCEYIEFLQAKDLSPEEIVIKKDIEREIRELLPKVLNETEQNMVCLKYNLDGRSNRKCMSDAKMAKILGITESEVKRILNAALKKLRKVYRR